MKNILATLALIALFFTGKSETLVCYESMNSCFVTNMNCGDMDISCSDDQTDDPWTNNCLCRGLLAWTNPDENNVVRYFQLSGDALQIRNADDTWTTLYDISALDSDVAFSVHFVDELDIVVMNVYQEDMLTNFIDEEGTDLSQILEETINISYDDEYFE